MPTVLVTVAAELPVKIRDAGRNPYLRFRPRFRQIRDPRHGEIGNRKFSEEKDIGKR